MVLDFTFKEIFGLWLDVDWALKNQDWTWIGKSDSPLIFGAGRQQVLIADRHELLQYYLLREKKHDKFEKSTVSVRLNACPVYVDKRSLGKVSKRQAMIYWKGVWLLWTRS